jgi:hypothetical protein
MKDKQTDTFLEKARQSLDHSIEELEPATVDKLNRIRQDAIREPVTKARRLPLAWWGPAGSVVTALVVAAVWLSGPEPAPSFAMNDMELLTSEEDLEMMQDIEFVAWLMEQEDADEDAG